MTGLLLLLLVPCLAQDYRYLVETERLTFYAVKIDRKLSMYIFRFEVIFKKGELLI
jgi:hypothetical protein